MLELQRVFKRFRSGEEEVRAIEDLSLRVSPGEMVAVQGPSGSGKTTLLLAIAGLVKADAGAIRFRGREIASFSEAQVSEYLMRELGFVYQGVQLMARTTALENACLKLLVGGVGLREAKARALPWLEQLGLGDRLAHTPEQLSSGERQRVAIARVLATEPHLILADEPTGNLDSTRSVETVELLHSLATDRGAIVVLVTHDTEAARIAHRQYTLRDGRLSATQLDRIGERSDSHHKQAAEA
ncbi:MAG: ABC transporter ATP-binding protein [Solirubrobacteraceae bacterium]